MEFSIEIVLGIITLINTVALGWVVFRRSNFQNSVDDSTASLNYRKLVIDLQAKVTEMEDLLGRSHLEVSMSIKMGEQPTVTAWHWLRREEDTKIRTFE
jgi:D-alanyl-lipoteichoic acid acyltransferase DltB (MBOAT superfamily)